MLGERVQQSSGSNRNLKKVAVDNVKVRKRQSLLNMSYLTQRNLSLLSELRREGRRSRFVDNRLGENISGLTDSQRAAKRVQRLRMRRAAHATKRSFALTDLDGGLENHMGQEADDVHDGDLVITHRGRPVMDLADEMFKDESGMMNE